VFDRVTSRPATFHPIAPRRLAPILALLALAALLTGCVVHDGRPAVYGYGYFGGYSDDYYDYDRRRDYGWRNRWHRDDGYYGHHHHRRYGHGYPRRYRHWW
jgi:hypothetical protein